ncbi:MAG: sulfatase [Candidatus Eisenbacteria sp.]|nr:sulfatase [Candidatus Eisenbacteria bacterium]
MARWPVAGALAVCLLSVLLCGCQPRARDSRPNLLIILIDTARADHLGCYGHHRPTSPNIDRLAERATLFDNAVAQSSWTLPSIASLLTGLYPTRHQAINIKSRLPLWRVTLPEILQERGYRTGAVISNTLVSSKYNMHQGFDDFDESMKGDYLDVTSEEVSNRAIQWLKDNHRDPFFLFLHYYDPHHAYIEHPGFEFSEPYGGWIDPKARLQQIRTRLWAVKPRDAAYLASLYDSEIAFTDHHVGRVLKTLDRLGLDGSTLIVITSDHGEEFMEHGWLGHTRDLYEEIVHVPLILRNPAMPEMPSHFHPPVELIDIMPTLLEMLGVSWDNSGIDGASFMGALSGAAYSDTIAFSDMCMLPIADRTGQTEAFPDDGIKYYDIRSLRMGHWKLVRNMTEGNCEIYNLRSDPGETVNLTGATVDPWFHFMEQELLRWIDAVENLALTENAAPDSFALDAETEERLRSLGYIQ